MITRFEAAHLAIFVGYHAPAGTEAAILDHTYSSVTVHQLTINGEPWGECELNAAVLGAVGIPVALVTGDQAVCSMATKTLPSGVRTVAVKEAFGNRSARSMHPERACALLREAARETLAKFGLPNAAQPFVPEPPFRLEVEFHRTFMADVVAMTPGSVRTGPYSVAIDADDIADISRWRSVFTTLAAAAIR
jgi:D-amino peptidase